MDLDNWPAFLVSGSTFGVSFAVSLQFMKWMLSFIAGRKDKNQEHIDEGMKHLLAGLREEVDRLKAEAIEDRKEVAEVRIELRDCERKHAQSEARVAHLEAVLQGSGDARQHAALIVASEKKDAKK